LSDQNTITLVLPVYKPSIDWVEYTLSKLRELEAASGSNVNLIVVNDGSEDRVPFDLLKEKHSNVIIHHLLRNAGKGAALRAGFSRCETDTMLFTDADFPYEVESMASLIHTLSNGADVVLGYREEDYYASVPWFRRILSEAFRFVLKSILRFPITDTQCGIKGMNQKGKEIFLRTKINRFLVDMEFIKMAVNSNCQIDSCVVHLRNDVQFSKMGLGVLIPESLNFIRILLK
jgi:glycosyltransferase involved in cell wall biosynthesis